MKTRSNLIVLVLLGLYVLTAFKIDDDPFSLLLKKMEAYNQKNPQEKVHLHLDKPYYAIGDDIWFKAYVLNAQTSKLTDLSNILYVELINESDSVKKQIKLPLYGGVTWGDFKLTDSLSEGNYRIRAYTQLMRNIGPAFFFDKTIKIGNAWANKVFTNAKYSFSEEKSGQQVSTTLKFTDKNGDAYKADEVSYIVQMESKNVSKGKETTDTNGEIHFTFLNTKPEISSGKIIATLTLPNKQKIVKTIPITSTSNHIDVQFFPEGGSMIQNIPSKIGIKAISSTGLGKDIEGSVLDNEGTVVTSFATTHLGMGNFILNPQSGKTYTATIRFSDHSEKKFQLPQAMPSGYTLMVNNTDSAKVNIKIYVSQDLLGKGELNLTAQNNGMVYFGSKAKTDKQVIAVNIPKKDLPSGILQLTLFDPANRPVVQRLAYIENPLDMQQLKVTSDKKVYGKRGATEINLNAVTNGKPILGTFSVAVTNTAVVQPDEDNESNIFTTLLLTSDLTGYIEKPNYYFVHPDKTTRQDLDNLLLTQGWTRFLWKNVINDVPPVLTFQPEKSLKISGTITTLGGKPLDKGRVSLFSTSGGLFMIDTISDAKGRFSFDNIAFNDSTKFVIQARTVKNKKNAEIKLDIVPGQVVTKNPNTGDIEVNVNESISAYIKGSENYFEQLTKSGRLQRTYLLKEVNIVEKKTINKNSSNLNHGMADAVITADQLGTCVTLSQCLQGRVAGLIIKNGIPYLMRNGGSVPMQIIIDGMYVEPEFLDTMTPMDVETIEVLKSIGNTAIYGSRGGGGVLIITTKRGGGITGNSYTPGIITYNPKGYYSSRQFYSPKYTAESSAQPDLRTTVYWDPQIITDATGNAKFNYFNTDQPGIYRIVVEGINVTGQIGRAVYTYEVK